MALFMVCDQISAPMIGSERITIRRAGPGDEAAWDQFIDAQPAATFFHRFGWAQVIEHSFGHSPHYLLAAQAGEIVGILPLCHKTSTFFGNALISLPFLSYGGVVADDPDVAYALEERAQEIASKLRVDYIELRNVGPRRSDWIRQDQTYASFSCDIPPDRDAIIRSVPMKGRRHALRRSLAQGLTFEIQDDLNDFYTVLSESYRNLGTPIFPKRYFQTLIEAFGSDFEICVVRGPSGPVATSLVFAFRDHVHPFYAGGTATARSVNANDFLFLHIMCRALERGYARFDFGRSKLGTGSFAYKTYWGFEPTPLNYEYKLIRGQALPDLNPLNPRYSRFVKLWRRLPIPVSRLLGPYIIRHLD